ncbi:tail fiber protein [Vibrio cholerae]|nr:tail fiber protein [Vibrio cholerae]
MPSIQVTGIMKDPITGVESDGELRIISKINYGQTTKNADALVVLSSAGEYDFQLVHGKHLFAVKSKGAQAFTNIGTVVVGEGSPSPIDIITLIATSNEEPDPILITQLQLIAAEAAVSAAEAAQSETNAANSASLAAGSEANAAQSELAANDSAASAETSASNAAQSELNASNSATAAALSESNAAQSSASASDDADRAEAAALTASSGVIDRGAWDASAGLFPTPTTSPIERSDWYRISVSGVMSDGVQPDVEVKVSDNLYWDRQNGVWYKIDNTDKVNSVNGKEGDVVLVADDIDDVYSKTEVLQITDPLGTRVTDLENTVDSHDLSLDNHETRITDVETLASNNQTALGTKADADTVIVKSNGTTGGIDVPRWTTATRPDTTETDKAIFGFNTDTDEYEAYNPETNEWGAVGGGGIPTYIEQSADFSALKKKAHTVDMTDGVSKSVTIDSNFTDDDWFAVSFMKWDREVTGLYADILFTDALLTNGKTEYDSLRIVEPCVIEFERIGGKWEMVGYSGGAGSWGALENRVAELEEDTGWIDLKPFLVNGWAEHNTDYPVRGRKINGVVYLEGLLAIAGATASSAINLPAELQKATSAFLSSTTSTNEVARISVGSTLGINNYTLLSGTWASINCVYSDE